jgi:secondary thiamine-phosphate synthase enzyme
MTFGARESIVQVRTLHRETAAMPHVRRWTFKLDEEFGHRNISPEIRALVEDSGIQSGLVTAHLTGSTGAITTIEYEPGAIKDLRRALDQIAPATLDYEHNKAWGDGNGFSHVRSALLKTSLTIPVIDGELQLGTWQEVLLLNLDNRARSREVVAVVVGD